MCKNISHGKHYIFMGNWPPKYKYKISARDMVSDRSDALSTHLRSSSPTPAAPWPTPAASSSALNRVWGDWCRRGGAPPRGTAGTPPRGTAGAGAGGGRILLMARAELTNRSAAGGRSSQLPPRRGGGSPTRRATPRSFPHTGRRRSSERRLCTACSSWGLKMTEGCGEHGWSCAIGILWCCIRDFRNVACASCRCCKSRSRCCVIIFVASVLSGYCKCLIWMLRLQCEIWMSHAT